MTLRRLAVAATMLAVAGCGGAKPQPFAVPGTAGSAVDVGGPLLYFECGGRRSPTVLLASGIAEATRTWRDLEIPLAATTRVGCHARPATGRRGPTDTP